MNVVLLDTSDFTDDRHAVITDRRAEHICTVHRAACGDRLRVGRINGSLGVARVIEVSAHSVRLEIESESPPPPALPITLVLALPRPNVVHRIVQATVALGIKRLWLIAARRVEKSYWQSPLLHPDRLRAAAQLGLEQAGDTMLPEISLERRFRPFVQDRLAALTAGSRRLLAHPPASAPCPAALGGALSVAVGPEGGFVPYEVDLLTQVGFEPVTLGRRVLRVEHAVVATIGRLLPLD